MYKSTLLNRINTIRNAEHALYDFVEMLAADRAVAAGHNHWGLEDFGIAESYYDEAFTKEQRKAIDIVGQLIGAEILRHEALLTMDPIMNDRDLLPEPEREAAGR